MKWGTTTWVDSIEQSPGGNGANTSYTLATLGVPARLKGMVGRDWFGEAVLERMLRAGVDISLVERSRASTAMTVALVHPDGARAFLHQPGSSGEAFAQPIEFQEPSIEGCTRFHLANPFAMPLMRRNAAETLRRARAAGLSTSVDAGWDACGEWMDVLGPCLRHVDLLFVNQDEARMLSGTDGPADAARILRGCGAGTVVVKLGGDGCAVYSDARTVQAPAFAVPVVDTTGAGDCHTGGFLAALEHGATLEQAAEVANAVGALNVQKLGAAAGVRSWEETVAWMARARRKQA